MYILYHHVINEIGLLHKFRIPYIQCTSTHIHLYKLLIIAFGMYLRIVCKTLFKGCEDVDCRKTVTESVNCSFNNRKKQKQKTCGYRQQLNRGVYKCPAMHISFSILQSPKFVSFSTRMNTDSLALSQQNMLHLQGH